MNNIRGELLLTPSRIYAADLYELMHRVTTPHGIAHITGGGIGGNLSRILKTNQLGCLLNKLPTPHQSMLELQKLGNLSDTQAYTYWNMGVAMLLVVPKSKAQNVVEFFQTQNIAAQICGTIIEQPNVIIQSKGLHANTINYKLK